MAAVFFNLAWDVLGMHLEPKTPKAFNPEAGLPCLDRMLQAMNGASSSARDVRRWVGNHLYASFKRIEELEGIMAGIGTSDSQVAIDNVKEECATLQRRIDSLMVAGDALAATTAETEAENESLKAEIAALKLAAPTNHDSQRVESLDTALEQARATYGVYYSGWKRMEKLAKAQGAPLTVDAQHLALRILEELKSAGFQVLPYMTSDIESVLFNTIQASLPNLPESQAAASVETQTAPVTAYSQEELDKVKDGYTLQIQGLNDDFTRVEEEIKVWTDTARTYSKNADYYRGLLDEIANSIGQEAYLADDGGLNDSPVRAKLPELVATLVMATRPSTDVAKTKGPQRDILDQMVHQLKSRVRTYQTATGPIPSPVNSFLTLNALDRDGIRVERIFDGYDYASLAVPEQIKAVTSTELLQPVEFMVETSELLVLFAWKGKHPSSWSLGDSTIEPVVTHPPLHPNTLDSGYRSMTLDGESRVEK